MSEQEQNQKLPMASREKYWSELNDEQKVERIRIVVRELMSLTSRIESRLRRIEKQFEQHNHNSGVVVVPVTLQVIENEAFGCHGRKMRAPSDPECYI